MKFDCDYFKDKREARWKRRLEWFKKSQEWHKWYAWFPVKLGPNDCRWLETIETRIVLATYMKGYDETALESGEYTWQARAIPAQSA